MACYNDPLREGDWGANGRFNCCEGIGGTPYPKRYEPGYEFCYDNT
jgi:hypothetical protein